MLQAGEVDSKDTDNSFLDRVNLKQSNRDVHMCRFHLEKFVAGSFAKTSHSSI